MKKIQREETKVIVTNIYVSVDGKEFTNEADCLEWESSYRGTLEASWQLIKKEQVDGYDFGIPYVSADSECYILRPKDINEVALINAYMDSVTDDFRTHLTVNHIGKLVLLDFGYDRYSCSTYILTDILAEITDRVAKMETTIPANE
jgi:hypothetical protein